MGSFTTKLTCWRGRKAADQADVPDGLSIPDELARREKRLVKLAEARANPRIAVRGEARAKERYEQEAAEHKAKLAAREAKAAATGKKPGGRPPQPPEEGARPSDQINLTDEDSRIMPVAGGGFEQCYNAPSTSSGGRGGGGQPSRRRRAGGSGPQ